MANFIIVTGLAAEVAGKVEKIRVNVAHIILYKSCEGDFQPKYCARTRIYVTDRKEVIVQETEEELDRLIVEGGRRYDRTD